MAVDISRVELEDGQIVAVEHPEDWSEAKIKAFARLNRGAAKRTEDSGAADNSADELTTADFVKLGLSRFATQFVPDTFLVSKEERERELAKAMQGQQTSNPMQLQEGYARDMAGVPRDAEIGLGGEITAALSDPTSLAGTPLRRGLGAFLKASVPAVTATAGGTTAGAVAPQFAQEMGAPPIVQDISGAVVGGVTGVATATATGSATTGTAIKLVKDTKAKLLGEKEGDGTLNVASDAMANSMVKAEIDRIKETTKPEEVSNAVESLAMLKEEIPDLEISGIVSVLSDNPIAKNWIKKTSQNNKAFEKEIIDKIKRDATKISSKFSELLGYDEPVVRSDIESVVSRKAKEEEVKLRDRVEKQTANIDKALDKLAVQLTGTKDEVAVGNTANRLKDRRVAIIRQEADKLYSAADRLADRVKLTQKQVFDVYDQFKGARLQDFFGPTSRTAALLEKSWSPKKTEASSGREVYEMPEVSGRDLISLKKAVNREISDLMKMASRNSEQEQRLSRLYTLKGVVRKSFDDKATTAPKFVEALRKADNFYYKELGLPLDSEGLRQFSSRRFDRQAASTLMDYEQAKDYVDFVGPSGMAVVRHAVRLKAEKAGVIAPDGQVNQSQLGKFIRRNKRLIDFTGLGPEFSDIEGNLRTIRNTQARHNEAYKEKARELTQGFFKAITDKSLNTIVTDMLREPGTRRKYLKDINRLNTQERELVLTGLRQEVLGKAATTKGSMQEYVNSNSEAFTDFFGREYVGNINKIAGLQDLLKRVNNLMKDSMGETPVVDTLERAVGFGIGEAAGTLRNQILTPQRKAINLTMKSVVTKGKNKYYVKSADVLLDPDVVQRLANPPEKGVSAFMKGTSRDAIGYAAELGNYYLKTLNESLGISVLRATNAAESVSREEKTEVTQ